MTTAPPATGPVSWTCHAGDLPFTLTAPAAWAAKQQQRLAEFLTDPPGLLQLSGFALTIIIADQTVQRLRTEVMHRPARRIEPIPGLHLQETSDGATRTFTPIADNLENRTRDYVVQVHGQHIDLALTSTAALAHRYPLRLIREAMLRTYENAGGVVFHAAGAAASGAGVMICGPPGVGKTTTLACLLRTPGTTLLSNDRLILHHGRLIAVPLPVPTGHGTIRAFPELITAAAARTEPPAAFRTPAKHAFTARGFATAFGARLEAAAPPRLILLPRLSETSQPPQVRRLNAEQARTALACNCYSPRDAFWIRPWLVPRTQPDTVLQQQANTQVEHLARTVPCIEVRFGTRTPIHHLQRTLNPVLGGNP